MRRVNLPACSKAKNVLISSKKCKLYCENYISLNLFTHQCIGIVEIVQ